MASDPHYKAVLLFGAPGVGKGTQGKLLGAVPGFFHLSTGDMFRSMDAQSEMGKVFAEYSSRGELVPDEVTIDMWRRYTHALTVLSRYRPHADLLLLDGVPRTIAQARLMDHHVQTLRVVHLACVDENAMIERLKGRVLKEKRVDDAREDVIRRRLDIYKAETRPLLDHYGDSKVSTIDALGTPAQVLQRVLAVLAPLQAEQFGDAIA